MAFSDTLDEMFVDLSTDPRAAFVEFFGRMDRALDDDTINQQDFIVGMETFIDVYQLEFDRRNWSENYTVGEISSKFFSPYFQELRKLRLTEQVKLSRQDAMAVFDAVQIGKTYKPEIRELIEQIKQKIGQIDIDLDKKDSLMKKLNHFLHELDQSKTRLNAITATSIQLASATGQVAEELEPVMSLLERAKKLIGLGAEPTPQLPKWEPQKQLPAPDNAETETNEASEEAAE